MEVERFMERAAADPEAIAHLKQRLLDNGLYVGSIVSADGQGTLLVVKPAPDMVGHYDQIHSLIADKIAQIKQRGGSEEILFSGRPIIEGVFGIYMPAEMKRMQPIVMGLLVLLLWLAFRAPRGVFLPLAVVVLAELWTLGTMAGAGKPIYTITTMLPVLILAIGIADAVHFLSREGSLAHANPSWSKRERILETMHELWKPMLMTSVTTGAGFLSMLSSDVIPIQLFGVFAAIGVAYAFFITVTLLPAALMLLKEHPAAERKAIFSGYIDWMGGAILNHRKTILAVFAVVVLIGAAGLSQLSANSSMVNNFKPGDPLRTADTVLNEHFSGTNALDLMIDTGKADGLLDPQVLQGLAKIQSEAELMPVVGDSSSIAEFLATMNEVMHSGDKSWRAVPDSSDLAAQYLLLYSFSGAPDDFATFITGDYRMAHLRLNLKTDETAAVNRVVERLHSLSDEIFPAAQGYKVEWAGSAYTNHRFSELIISGQIRSLLWSLSMILIVCLVLFRRIQLAVLAMIPVALAVVVDYGVMGWLGIPLDIGTALLGSIALGIGVDFALHYLYRYHDLRTNAGMEYEAAVQETNHSVGRAVLFNAFVVIGGFLVLLSAHLYPQMKLGALVSASMLVCYLASTWLFPVLLGMGRRPVV